MRNAVCKETASVGRMRWFGGWELAVTVRCARCWHLYRRRSTWSLATGVETRRGVEDGNEMRKESREKGDDAGSRKEAKCRLAAKLS